MAGETEYRSIGVNTDILSEENIYSLIKHIKKKSNTDNKQNIDKSVKVISKTTKKYKLLLELVNKLLVDMGKDEIDDLLEFKMIDRLDIIKCDRKIIFNMEKEICKSFKKNNCFYRKQSPNYILSILRNLITQIGLKMTKINKNVFTRTHIKTYKRTVKTVYSIVNI